MTINASAIGFLVLFFFVFLIPGLLLSMIVGLRSQTFLFSVALSYAINVSWVLIARLFGFSVIYISTAYVLLVIGFLVTCLAIKRKNLMRFISITLEPHYWTGIVAIGLFVIGFCSVFGVYVEIPADILIHLEFVRVAISDISDSRIYPANNPFTLFGKGGHYWYYIHGLLTHLTNFKSHETFVYSIVANTILLMVCVYNLALLAIRPLFTSIKNRVLVALLIVLLFFLHFGVNIFSFIRYYSFAPTVLNMVVYFAAVSIFVRFTSERGISARYLLLFIVLFFTAAMVHLQEAVFIAIMALLMLSYIVLARWFGFAGDALAVTDHESSEYYYRRRGFDRMIPHGWLVIVGVVILTAAFFWSHYFIESSTPHADSKLVFLGAAIPALKGWYVLNPTYQFFRVVTPWGLLVYGLFFWHWKDFRGSPFLVAGMLSPLFTVFNPFFVDLFLRHTTYITLWRFCYMIPLVFVAGYLFYKAMTRFRQSTLIGKFGYGLMVVGLIALLFPIQVGSFTVPYSRMQTLMPVKKENSPEHWADLLEYLRTLPKREQILTDPVTGYFVSALTKHHSPRYKFFKLRYKHLSFDSYDDKPLAKYKNWLVIVNLRDGGHSRTGELSRHWSADVLKVSRQYTPQLIAHLKDNPNRFKELWSTQDIKVYRILK